MPRRYCTFDVGGLLLGIDVERVQEVLRDQEITPVPLAHPSVLGLLNLRGQIVTAIDARHRLGLAERTPGQSVAHVIVRCADEAVSLAVDVEDEVVDVDDEAYEPVPETVGRSIGSLLTGIYKLDAALLLVLDTDLAVSVAA
jgi:purine-binding chemotaxis protein CheW